MEAPRILDIGAQVDAENRARQERLGQPAKPLFGSALPMKTQAWVGEMFSDGSSEASGFRSGAQALVRAVEEGWEPADVLVFPIVFCYRHSVELMLKASLYAAKACGDIAIDDRLKNALEHHDLRQLWTLLRPTLDEVGFTDEAELARTDERIEELHQHDPSSFTFRYARSKKGDKRKLP